MKRLLSSVAAIAAVVLFATTAVAAPTAAPGGLVNVAGASGIALGGYDPVAFFTDGKPAHGDPGVKSTCNGATYFFASKAHKSRFDADPERYVPQFGGKCAYGAALGALFPVDVSTWQVRRNRQSRPFPLAVVAGGEPCFSSRSISSNRLLRPRCAR